MSNAPLNPPPQYDVPDEPPAVSDLDLMSAARSSACVLLTGKPDAVRALARHIHSLSGWRNGPFTVVRCGWPEPIIEFLVFGAFTDAVDDSAAKGVPRPRRAQEGTVFLQEVWRLSPPFQARLADQLGVQSGTRSTRRWRLMASSSEPLFPRVIDGTFSDTLYYRLNAIHLVLG